MIISIWNSTRTRFQLEILTINVIPGIVYFREIILESSWNVSETTPWVNIGSGNGLLLDGVKSLPEPKLIYHQ